MDDKTRNFIVENLRIMRGVARKKKRKQTNAKEKTELATRKT